MLVADVTKGMIGGNAIVGAGIPAATGMALSIQLLAQDRVAMCVFGDGAAQTGICHESMNIAALWKLPVIFLLENNEYGLTVHQSAQSSVMELSLRGASYGIPSKAIDGNDAAVVYQAVAKAAARARKGDGPTFIEAKTYRVEGFSTSDMGGYQSESELRAWKARDPITLSRSSLNDCMTDSGLAELEASADREVAEAFDLALSDEFPIFQEPVGYSPYSETSP
jgi:pyruvate dehydrogenase E1 component alpha subunit